MNIIHIDRQKSWTGQTNRLFQIVRGLRERGHDARVISQRGSRLALRCREAGIPVSVYPMRGWLFNLSAVVIALQLRSRRPDILHCHGPRDHLLSLIVQGLGGTGHVVRTKHNHKHLKSGSFSRLQYNRCARVVTVSEFVRSRLIEDGLDPGHVETIYTAVDTAHFTPREKNRRLLAEFGIADDELVIGCLSSLHVRKGIEELLKALASVLTQNPDKKIRCLLVGKKWQRWAEMARGLGIGREKIIFTGFRQDVADLLSVFDIYVLPSRDEGLGTSILEAMATGLPVIATTVGGITEAIGEDAGIGVAPMDPDALAAAMNDLIGDPARRDALGKNARLRAERIFSVETMIERTMQLYGHILGEGPA